LGCRAACKQNREEMFGLSPGQLDNKGAQAGCKAKTAKNQRFLLVFCEPACSEAAKTGLRRRWPPETPVLRGFWTAMLGAVVKEAAD
jgi:hypothetical protein